MTAVTTRTQEEIIDRFTEAADDDMFGWRREVLAAAMDQEAMRQVFPEIPPKLPLAAPSKPDTEAEAREYLAFAVEKILDHRGISASRSVVKLAEFSWLLGRDDVVAAMDAAEYAQYGAPQVRAFAEGMGWNWLPDNNPGDREAVELMSLGRLCEDECAAGCGQ